MNAGIVIPGLIFTAVLGGMRIAYGVDSWKEEERPFYQVWNRRTVYLGSCFWLIMLAGTLLLIPRDQEGIMPQGQSVLAARFADLLVTYGMLAVIDAGKRIVPDRVVVCFFLGQMLLGGACEAPGVLMTRLINGTVFAGLVILFAGLSKGKLGMGDAKLLSATAMTAGVMYTIQLICTGLLLSFLYGLWLLVIKRMSTKSEFPFVPFLALGIVINTIYAAL